MCDNCGNVSPPDARFCRTCGARLGSRRPAAEQPRPASPHFEYAPPRPYSWKTDEFQTHFGTPAGPLESVRPEPPVFDYGVPIAVRCPVCCGQFLPRVERRISSAGWIVFAVLLVVFFPLFWVGFLIKEDVRVCPSCGTRLS
ncbi:MAG: LITAF-like zinc ribbon domain-containing protein [Pyrinomonadaceae bacterium]